MIKAGIVGATGYSGIELFRILSRHPEVEIAFSTSESYAGRALSAVWPEVRGLVDMPLVKLSEAPKGGTDIVFLCLPQKESMAAVPGFLEAGAKVIDIGTDFRMDTAEGFQQWYGAPHTAPHLLEGVVYGLPEVNRRKIVGARLVSNPGCYPTAAVLGLAPLLEKGLIDPLNIVVDAKSGISGAGRKLDVRYLFAEANENVAPYNVGRSHRHVGEMEQELGKVAGTLCRIVFTPHLVPLNRGILSTMYVQLREDLTAEEALDLYEGRYAPEPFVRVTRGYLPETRFVERTNFCDVGMQRAAGTDVLVVVSALDNLIKGASGQAVQNMNLMFGLEETLGLR